MASQLHTDSLKKASQISRVETLNTTVGPDRTALALAALTAAALAAATKCAGGGASCHTMTNLCFLACGTKELLQNKHFKPAVGVGHVEASRIVAQEAQAS